MAERILLGRRRPSAGGSSTCAADRARLATRQAIHRAAVPARPTVTDALTEAADEVADRFGLDLRLDLASGIGMTPTRADALVRIACEALVNVAA
jgi:signal transduction histidine kinase